MKYDYVLPLKVSVAVLHLDGDNVSMEWLSSYGGGLYVLAVTGSDVYSRPYLSDDPVIGRIMDNSSLLVSLHDGGMIDFVRRSSVEPHLRDLSAKGMMDIGIAVFHDMDVEKLDSKVAALCGRRLRISGFGHDHLLREFVLEKLFRRILLPVLVLYLAVLAASCFAGSVLSEKIAEKREAYAEEIRAARKKSEMTAAQARLVAGFDAVSHPLRSSLFDRIASLLPDGMRLSLLSADSPRERKKYGVPDDMSLVIIKGESLEAGTVMSFAQNMKDSIDCRSIVVTGVDRDRATGRLNFEIHLMQ
ncbi:MAG: hypothetical protein NC115_01830 [Bacteroidales bacterium]|nr:hypothetical protein [Bacteroidales bacterium]